MEKLLEEERVCAGEAPFDIVPYIMARITHVEKMLELLRSERQLQILLDVQDEVIPENHGEFLWEISADTSRCTAVASGEWSEVNEKALRVSVTISELTEFVFGKRRIPGLEAVKVLNRICINESV